MKSFRGQNGFTLAEIIMTIVVGSIIIPPIILLMLTALQAPAVMMGTIKCNSLASDLLEEIVSQKWDRNSTGSGPIADALKTAPGSLGPESGEARSTFNDMDDYNGYTEKPPRDARGNIIAEFPDFTRSVQVFYVQGGSSGDYSTKLTVVSNFKKIIVTVQSSKVTNKVETVVANR